ncbi:MAG: DNA (cytosine-5-)-methyltransferase [Aquificales bacterium]|nr:DNA (cytosine-5-)-methyltransferase [Aquificales bacterium]
MRNYTLPIKVFDFFSGCGGTSRGFQDAGLETVFAIDNDVNAANTFVRNFPGTQLVEGTSLPISHPSTSFLLHDINEIATDILQPLIDELEGFPLLFSGCAPCQPFSKQKTQLPVDDPRKTLLSQFQRFVEQYKPEFVFIENVPGMQKVQGKEGPFDDFVTTLHKLKYKVNFDIISAQHYGIPQKRRRLVLIASRLGQINFPQKTHGPGTLNPKYATPQQWMDDFPLIEAGETHSTVRNHQAMNLSELNLRRIKATPIGGDRRDWPDELVLKCHSNGYKGHTDVYGRIKWNELSSCLTTKCTSLSNGRFGHPEQNRAISAREAACLQTFPRDFIFEGGISLVAKQIGNAVPVLLAQRFGENFNSHLKDYLEGKLNG